MKNSILHAGAALTLALAVALRLRNVAPVGQGELAQARQVS